MIDAKLLKYEISKKNMTIAGVCADIGINKSTYHRKIKNDGFLLREVNKITKLLDLPKDKAADIFFNV